MELLFGPKQIDLSDRYYHSSAIYLLFYDFGDKDINAIYNVNLSKFLHACMGLRVYAKKQIIYLL